jgi:hypothetical protein
MNHTACHLSRLTVLTEVISSKHLTFQRAKKRFSLKTMPRLSFEGFRSLSSHVPATPKTEFSILISSLTVITASNSPALSGEVHKALENRGFFIIYCLIKFSIIWLDSRVLEAFMG